MGSRFLAILWQLIGVAEDSTLGRLHGSRKPVMFGTRGGSPRMKTAILRILLRLLFLLPMQNLIL
jgi:hypothetical protein